ncbi:hypothetical protein CDD80_2980 [Ophiocordyceps camponoti-rufipedis]|uniref:Uncharacterized protein n=1 Tax=Ophiocordyceps camponoti-rufipedis TaxID=2004952 RepID=A0A2C5Z456_9HYPO|nr:hypothetical protein CDD80_2980 [Ophiocordyceps camponoti-rufipedis]
MKTAASNILIALLVSGALSAPASHQKPASLKIRREVQSNMDTAEAYANGEKKNLGLVGSLLKGLVPLLANVLDDVNKLTNRIADHVEDKDLIAEVVEGVHDLLTKKPKQGMKAYDEELPVSIPHHRHHATSDHQATSTYTRKSHKTSTSSAYSEPTETEGRDGEKPKDRPHRGKKTKPEVESENDEDEIEKRSIMMDDQDLVKRAESLDLEKLKKLFGALKKGKGKKGKKSEDESDDDKHDHKKDDESEHVHELKHKGKGKGEKSEESVNEIFPKVHNTKEKRSEMAEGNLRDIVGSLAAYLQERHSKTHKETSTSEIVKPTMTYATKTTETSTTTEATSTPTYTLTHTHTPIYTPTATITPTITESLTTSTYSTSLTTHEPTHTHTTYHPESTPAVDDEEDEDEDDDEDDEETCDHHHDHEEHEAKEHHHDKPSNHTHRIVTEGVRRK